MSQHGIYDGGGFRTGCTSASHQLRHFCLTSCGDLENNVGALIIRVGFWGDCGQKSEASTRKMSCASSNDLAAFELAYLTKRRNDLINATNH